MNNTRKVLKRALPAVLLAVVLGSATVLAQPFGGPPEEEGMPTQKEKGMPAMKGEYAERIKVLIKEAMAKELGLTEEQQAQLAEMRKANQAAGKELMASLKTAQSRLRETLGQYDADPATIEGLAAKVKAIQAQFVDHRIASVTQTKQILTAEQFAKIQEKAKERGRAFKEKRAGGHPTHGKFKGPGGPWGGGDAPGCDVPGDDAPEGVE